MWCRCSWREGDGRKEEGIDWPASRVGETEPFSATVYAVVQTKGSTAHLLSTVANFRQAHRRAGGCNDLWSGPREH